MQRRRKTSATRRERLRPDDFDDVQYSVEVVRLAKSPQSAAADAADDRTELVESAFVLLVGAAVVVLALAAGVVALETTTAMAREALWYLLPMVLLPALWFGVLHVWETQLLTPADTIDRPAPSSLALRSRRASKVAIF